MSKQLMPYLMCLCVAACTGSNFAGSSNRAGQDKVDSGGADSGASDAGDGGSSGGGIDSGNDSGSGGPDGGSSGGDLGSEGEPGNDSNDIDDDDLEFDEDEQWLAQSCTADNGEISFDECPRGQAAFLSDDGSGTRVGCCPLPSRDILDDDHDPVSRSSCQGDEIAVGASGNGFLCQRINTDKYKLGPARTVCYWGSGAGGNDGASDCSTVIDELRSLMNKTGDKDGCAAQPYGAVMQQKFGKDCGDQRSVEIIDRDTDRPIEMFP